MVWWIWIIAGLVLLALEIVVTSGLFLLFPAISAIVTGAFAASFEGFAPWGQWLSFTVGSFALTALFRKKALSRFSGGPAEDHQRIVGQPAIATTAIAPSERGSVEFQGTSWSAKNTGSVAIPKGGRCRIVRIEGLVLEVSPEASLPGEETKRSE